MPEVSEIVLSLVQSGLSRFALVSEASASSSGSGGGFQPLQLLPLGAILVVMYFFLIRPQQKRAKEHKDMVSTLRRGDRVLTSGGLIGTLTHVDDDAEVTLQIDEGVSVKIIRSSITQVLAKTEPLTSKLQKLQGGRSKNSNLSIKSNSKISQKKNN